MIPVSVLVTTKNEEQNLPRCLQSLKSFDEIIVVDSNSEDNTKEIAKQFDAQVINFTWNNQYPKKRQWCLDNLSAKHPYIFFVDADEEIPEALISEIKSLNFSKAGYFVKGQYMWQGKPLIHGLKNNKLVLFDFNKIEFPIIDDLDIEGMGEMEGHYQPVLKEKYKNEDLGQLKTPLLHFAYENPVQWLERHKRYANWEALMIKRKQYPLDPSKGRELLKKVFRKLPARDKISFLHSYIWRSGFRDGRAGYEFAKSRADYYALVKKSLKRR